MSLFGSIGGRLGAAGRALVGRADYSDYNTKQQMTEVGWSGVGAGSLGSGICRNTRAWLETLITHPRLAAAVNRIGTDVGKTNWCLLEDDPKTGKPREVVDHPLLTFLANPWQTAVGGTLSTIAHLWSAYTLLDGNAFFRMRLPAGGHAPTEMHPVPPHLIADVPCKDRPYYLFAAGTEEACDRVLPGEVLWFRRVNPLQPYGRGAGLAMALDDEVSQDNWAAKYNNSWFRNGARPDLLISLGALDPLEKKRIEETWKTRYKGIANAFKTFFLTAPDAKVHNLAVSHKDMQWSEGRKLLRDIIFQTFGLPPEVMGVVENSNRATADAAMYIYSLQVVLPMVSSFCDELNRLLVPMFFGDRKYGRDPRKVYLGFESPVRETEQFKLEKAIELFKAGAITRNQCLEITGFDPAPGQRGEEYLVPINMHVIGPNDPRPSYESANEEAARLARNVDRLAAALAELSSPAPARRNVIKIFAPRGGVLREIELERAA